MPGTMKTIRIAAHGGPEVLTLKEMPLKPPGPGEAQVRHTAIGVNFIDTYHRSGLYPVDLPHGIGMEAAGVVEAVGEGVTLVSKGDRVAYAGGPPGAYAEARNIDAAKLVPIPDDVEDELAAAVMLKGMTAEYLIRRTYQVRPGETVLFHAAAGGVGSIATQWLAHLGATVIGTVGSKEKAERARRNGVAHPVVYTEEDFATRVREITAGEGVPVVYDSVGRATFMKSLDCLKPRGLFVGFGNASGKPDPFDMGILAQKGSLYLTRPTLFTYNATRADLLASARAVFDVLASGAVKVAVEHRWPLAEVQVCHEALEGRRTTGPVLLLP